MPLADSNERTKTPNKVKCKYPLVQSWHSTAKLKDSLENIIKLMETAPEKNTYKILDIISGDSGILKSTHGLIPALEKAFIFHLI